MLSTICVVITLLVGSIILYPDLVKAQDDFDYLGNDEEMNNQNLIDWLKQFDNFLSLAQVAGSEQVDEILDKRYNFNSENDENNNQDYENSPLNKFKDSQKKRNFHQLINNYHKFPKHYHSSIKNLETEYNRHSESNCLELSLPIDISSKYRPSILNYVYCVNADNPELKECRHRASLKCKQKYQKISIIHTHTCSRQPIQHSIPAGCECVF